MGTIIWANGSGRRNGRDVMGKSKAHRKHGSVERGGKNGRDNYPRCTPLVISQASFLFLPFPPPTPSSPFFQILLPYTRSEFQNTRIFSENEAPHIVREFRLKVRIDRIDPIHFGQIRNFPNYSVICIRTKLFHFDLIRS